MSRRIAVIGSRSIANSDYSDLERARAETDWMFYRLDKYLDIDHGYREELFGTAILSGGAVGVDRLAQSYAEENDIPFFLYKPYHLVDTKVDYQPRYFFTRNKQIVDNCDEMIAFWDGKSHGTEDAIRYARKKRKPVTVIEPDENEIAEFF